MSFLPLHSSFLFPVASPVTSLALPFTWRERFMVGPNAVGKTPADPMVASGS